MNNQNIIYNVGVNPSHIAITPNDKYAYVTNSNNYSIPGSDNVTVLNLHKGHAKLTIYDESFVEPYRIAIDNDGRYAYVCNSGSPQSEGELGTVSVINIFTNTVTKIITGFDGPGGIVLTKKFAYVTNYGAPGGKQSGNGNTVSVVNLKTKQIVDTIIVDQAPSSLILSPCHSYLYVINYTDGTPEKGTLNVICTRTNTVIKTITGFFGPFGIAISEDGRYGYVTNFGSNNFSPYGSTVSVVDLKKFRIIKNIETGIQPAGIAISRNFAYVSNYNALYAGSNYTNLTPGLGSISVICLEDNKIVGAAIPIGQCPSTLILSHDEKNLYICNYVQNTVTELELE